LTGLAASHGRIFGELMSRIPRDLLTPALRSVAIVNTYGELEWDLLVRQARRAGLLARLATNVKEGGLGPAVPEAARAHLEGEQILAEKLRREVGWEVRCIKAALAGVDTPIVLLKGAAYAVMGLPPAQGRLFADIDILVRRESLDRVEAALLQAGWGSVALDPYDERYYRRWMHQLPPMTNFARRTVLDVHHTIVAPTRRLALDADKLFAAAIDIPGHDNLKTLVPADIVLHSAAHLLNEGEFHRGLRDLDDINLLLRHFIQIPQFWDNLLARAGELDLRRPLYYALRYAAARLGTPVPAAIRNHETLAPPGVVTRALMMDCLFERALRPDHPSCRDGLSAVALWLLYVRAHHLLMPTHILVPHLLRKALRRWRDRGEMHPPVRAFGHASQERRRWGA
jgi:hypothetical protein